MRKLYFLLSLCIIAQVTFAQTDLSKAPKGRIPFTPVKHSANRTTANNSFKIDYDDYEFDMQAGVNDGYVSFIYDMNYHYVAADSSLKYTVVVFDSLIDTETLLGYSLSSVTSLRVDTIYSQFGYENNSGVNDTLIFKIMSVTGASNFPSSTVYKADTIILTPDDASPNWTSSSIYSFPIDFTLPSGKKKFAVRMEYHGNKMDTLGIVAGFTNEGVSCGSSPYKAMTSVFGPNSYRLLTQYTSFGLLPQSNGNDVYYDCDQSGSPTAGDGKSYYQNANIAVWVTTDPTGINDKTAATAYVSQNQPNPFNKTSTINYSLTSNTDVTINFYDVTGRIVKVINDKNAAAGKHAVTINSTEFANGVYFYTFNAGGVKQTKKNDDC